MACHAEKEAKFYLHRFLTFCCKPHCQASGGRGREEASTQAAALEKGLHMFTCQATLPEYPGGLPNASAMSLSTMSDCNPSRMRQSKPPQTTFADTCQTATIGGELLYLLQTPRTWILLGAVVVDLQLQAAEGTACNAKGGAWFQCSRINLSNLIHF